MEELRKGIEARALEDLRLSEVLQKRLQNCPPGRIQVTTANGYPRYYWIRNGQRKYIRKENVALIGDLMQKSYDQNLLQSVNKELETLHQFLDRFDPDHLLQIYENLHAQRKEFVVPAILSDDQFAKKWLEETRERASLRRNSYPLPENFQTMNGEFVRSKSEKFILDLLKQFEVYYVYEAPLVLSDGIVYPDVTALNKRTREPWYWEHLGMMDDPEYANDAINKLARYERSGILIGKQLIVTMESSRNPLGTFAIEQKIRQFLL